MEEDEIRLGYKDYLNTGGFADQEIGTTSGAGGLGKSRENFLTSYKMMLSQAGNDINPEEFNDSIYYVKNIPEDALLFLNIHVLFYAILFIVLYKNNLTKDKLKEFKSKKNIPAYISIFDLIRYIRYINKTVNLQ